MRYIHSYGAHFANSVVHFTAPTGLRPPPPFMGEVGRGQTSLIGFVGVIGIIAIKNFLHYIINTPENPCQYFLDTLYMNRIAIISPDASGEVLKNLRALDLEPVAIPKTGLVVDQISGHPDIQVFIHENRAFCHPDISLSFAANIETHAEVIICGTRLSKKYPADIPYNIACAGPHAFHHRSGIDPTIGEYLTSRKIAGAPVGQGYAKCSTLIVNPGSIVTSDVSIHRAAVSRGVESLLLASGHIDLPGYAFGFIGGATGVIDDLVLFTGSMSHHPDYDKIAAFIEGHEKKIVPLGSGRAVDLGTIFVI
jgi:hypothetical protein